MTDAPSGAPDEGTAEDPASGARWSLTLYVAGTSPRSTAALETVRRLCDEELAGQAQLRVVDVSEEPALLVHDHIYAVPTLVKHLPAPLRQLVGDLADADRVRAALELGPLRPPPPTPEPPL